MLDYKELGRGQDQKWAKGVAAMNDTAETLYKQELLPEKFTETPAFQIRRAESPKVYPEISLEEEFERQRQIVIERVIKPLNMNEASSLSQLPSSFPERLISYDGLSLSVPLIPPKFKGVPWINIVDASGLVVSQYLRERIEDLKEWEDPRKIVLPDKPYATWVQDGSRYVYRKPIDVRQDLQEDERGGNQWDGLALALFRPDMVKNMFWDLIGASVGSDGVPCLDWLGGGPGFDYYFSDAAGPGDRALVCGSQFKT